MSQFSCVGVAQCRWRQGVYAPCGLTTGGPEAIGEERGSSHKRAAALERDLNSGAAILGSVRGKSDIISKT